MPTSEALSFYIGVADRLMTSFRELLLVEGTAQQGLGNWQAVAEHVGTRTREEVEEHYNSVYIDSPNWPRPVCFFFQSLRSYVC